MGGSERHKGSQYKLRLAPLTAIAICIIGLGRRRSVRVGGVIFCDDAAHFLYEFQHQPNDPVDRNAELLADEV